MRRSIITVGLGFGDEGKGATVDSLCRLFSADLVIRYCGGAQAGHTVVLPNGQSHVFSQFGAGTLAGVETYLDQHVIIDPLSLREEAKHLNQLNVLNPYEKFSVHEQCLVTTPYHRALNRLRELARSDRHGSCSMGIGETRKYWLTYGEEAPMAKDLVSPKRLIDKLRLLKVRLLQEVQEFMRLIPSDKRKEALCILMWNPVDVAGMLVAEPRIHIVKSCPPYSLAVFEGAQGVLLDEWYGFHPNTTWSTTTTQHALELLDDGDEYCVLGLTRAYPTRHGAGPFPTESAMLSLACTDQTNVTNAWQGEFRTGFPDMVLLEYAASIVQPLDGVVINHVDQYTSGSVCHTYKDAMWLDSTGRITPIPGDLVYQGGLGRHLLKAEPDYLYWNWDLLRENIVQRTAPLAMISMGKTCKERTCYGLKFRKFNDTEPKGTEACSLVSTAAE